MKNISFFVYAKELIRKRAFSVDLKRRFFFSENWSKSLEHHILSTFFYWSGLIGPEWLLSAYKLTYFSSSLLHHLFVFICIESHSSPFGGVVSPNLNISHIFEHFYPNILPLVVNLVYFSFFFPFFVLYSMKNKKK